LNNSLVVKIGLSLDVNTDLYTHMIIQLETLVFSHKNIKKSDM